MVKVDLEVQGNRGDCIEEFLTPKDIQQILKIGRDKTYKLISTKGFPSIKIGNTVRIPKDRFEKWVNTYIGSEFKI